MPQVESTFQSKVIDLVNDAFSGFCEDIGGMFGVDMDCEQVQVHDKAGTEIKKSYKKLAVVYSVQCTGTLNGEFKILIDKAGLFTMAGVLVMLPGSRILSNAKRGTLAEANDMADSVGEIGNLLVGCWDRTFRLGLKDNTHFLHTGTFIGDPDAGDNDILDLANLEEALFVSYKMCVGEYPEFQCGVYLPPGLLEEVKTDSEPEVQDVADPEPDAPTAKPSEAEVQATATVETQEEAPKVVEPEPVPEPKPEPPVPTPVVETPQVEAVEIPAPAPTPSAEATPIPELAPAPAPPPNSISAPVPQLSAEMVSSASVSPDMITARDIMQTHIHWASADDTVGQAQDKMQLLGTSCLLIGDSAKLKGIVTQSDLAGAASIYLRPVFAKWRRPEDDATLQIRLKWIMSQQVYSVKPETLLPNIVHLKCKFNISYLPVVDVQGQVVGVVTTRDIYKAIVNKEWLTAGVSIV